MGMAHSSLRLRVLLAALQALMALAAFCGALVVWWAGKSCLRKACAVVTGAKHATVWRGIWVFSELAVVTDDAIDRKELLNFDK